MGKFENRWGNTGQNTGTDGAIEETGRLLDFSELVCLELDTTVEDWPSSLTTFNQSSALGSY